MNPTLLIPIYDHGDTIRDVVGALAPLHLPCIIVDDGSGEATRSVLEQIARDFPWVEVFSRKENGGRGAALETGYRRAAERGFSHALQLDADGQHDPSDAPRFLEAMTAHPDALVLGVPVFDESAPKARLYGRQISRGIVWLCTLSREIADPLCGYRGIPLAPAVALLDRVATGNHMEFDPELAVRLYWAGTPVVSVSTRVVYREGGLSHFDMLDDNARLSWLYTRLVLGMPLRAPRLLLRTLGRRAS